MTAARSEVLRTALTAGAGVGAAVALMLAFRRQRQQELNYLVTARLAERNAEDSKHDATERRVTELYVKAVEQLGSEKAVVRLGGLYALDRLAGDYLRHREKIVNVICAYLRMPYASPQLRDAGRSQEEMAAPSLDGPTPDPGGDRRVLDDPGERQVRITAQRVLAEHLRATTGFDEPHPGFWRGIQLDLTGAALIDLDFSHCNLHGTKFTGATFIGDANFYEAEFSGTNFDRATFCGKGTFSHATFGTGCTFRAAVFREPVEFSDATFRVGAVFDGTTFADNVAFDGATFRGSARFKNATFAGNVSFWRVVFERSRRSPSTIGQIVPQFEFARATFGGDVVDFAEMVGVDRVSMTHARVLKADTECVWPPGWQAITEPDGDRVLRQSVKATAADSDAQDKAGITADSDRRAAIARADGDGDHPLGKDA